MYTGKLVFSQLMEHLPWDTFHRYVKRYNGNHKVKSFFCAEQYRCMAFAQLAYRDSLRDVETCLRAPSKKTLSHGNLKRHITQYSCCRKQKSQLANLRGFRTAPYP